MYKTTQKLARNLVLILLLLLLVACERTDSLTVTISNDQQEATAERAIAFVERFLYCHTQKFLRHFR